MPKVIYAIDMMWQFGLSPNGLIVDLNCGWYCLNAALHYKNPSQPSSLPPSIPRSRIPTWPLINHPFLPQILES
jgi:hypothetical protein